MASGPKPPLLGATRAGWHIVAHPLFLTPLLERATELREREKSGQPGWESSAHAKLFRRVVDLIANEIPRNPAAPEYEQGNTLGRDARGWRRAKFLGRFRLFFRFDSRSKVIVFVWVNDENTLRKEGSATDPYAVFRNMLIAGNPPHDWDKLLDACREELGDRERRAYESLVGPVAAVNAQAPPSQSATKSKVWKKPKRG